MTQQTNHPPSPTYTVAGRMAVIRRFEYEGGEGWIIGDSIDSKSARLCDDGAWRGYCEVRTCDQSTWKSHAAALAFLEQQAEDNP